MSASEQASRRWRKSSYSGESGEGGCVEVAFDATAVAVRDSKNSGGPVIDLDPSTWRRLLAAVR